MSRVGKLFRGMALLCIAWNAAPAQTPADKPSQATAQSEAGEPRATTSDSATPAPPAAAPVSTAGSTPAAAKAAGRHAAPESEGGRKAAPKGEKTPSKSDRLDLGLATVTGDHEQPKVMYIVPWKKSDIGDLAAKPMNSLVDEILAPVDRDVFKREVIYYQAMQADASQNVAPPKPAQQGEK
ncbi:MAG TPA: hypothetical protein VN692_16560 [Steroidobacteraceae bacterium]|nr:hypothetical protein [Steroidobacteraceae bacterium]